MKRSSSHLRRIFAVASLAGSATVVACGASINAVYEGDVRFEHCMALDEREGEKSTIQKSCWDEWVQYYTYGQTRDRVDYARRRQKALSGESDFEEHLSPGFLAQRAVPEPTTVLAPPPMMFSDAGKPPDDATSDAARAAPEPPAAACEKACKETWPTCEKACSTPACEKACTTAYKRCMKKCF